MSLGVGLVRAAFAGTAFGALLYVSPLAVASGPLVDPALAAIDDPADLPGLIGSQGIDTALAPTDSARTVRGRGAFADLAVTVNQTENLVNQAVSVTWTGGIPTRGGPGRNAAQYLQIMQCWGDDDGTVPENPGPPPEQCVFGAIGDQFGGPPFGLMSDPGSVSRLLWNQLWGEFDEELGFFEEQTGLVWTPFTAVDGTTVPVSRNPDFVENEPGSLFWTNPYYSQSSTNEVIVGRTASNGTGAEFVEVQTGVEAPWLGCGRRAQEIAPGEFDVPKCWIVVVPRGEPVDENFGRSLGDLAVFSGVASSPFNPNSWANRIAIPLEFNPLDLPCDFAQARRLGGAETAQLAVTSWQPTLCGSQGLPPFNYTALSEQNARRQQAASAPGAPELIGVIEPHSPEAFGEDNPVVYAPLTLSGVTIAFNYQRATDVTTPVADDAFALDGIRVDEFNLTPRLVAKLLTQSYTDQLSVGNRLPTGEAYDWAGANPRNLAEDPDFIQFNPEFRLLDAGNRRNMSGLVLQQASSDVATVLWEWVLEDDEAAAWLAGEADEFGMNVNPWFSTDGDSHPLGIPFAAETPNNFPKPDPYCFVPEPTGPPFNVQADPLCGINWNPYVGSLRDAAVRAARGDDGAKIIANTLAPRVIDYWKRTPRQSPGDEAMIAVTDTASAQRFGLQAARLSRADDNGPDRAFVAPDAAGLLAGVDAMEPREVESVLQPDHDAAVDGAYPLTVVTYGAVTPLALEDEARADYASFVEYAVGPGQVPGFEPGQLPPGYAPLPDDLTNRALAAAGEIRSLEPPPPSTTTTTTVPETTTTTEVTTTTVSATTTPVTVSGTVAATTPVIRPPTQNSGSSSSSNSGASPSSPFTPATATTTTTTTIAEDDADDDAEDEEGAEADDDSDETDDATSSTSVTTVAEPVAESDPPTTPGVDVGASRLAVPGVGGAAMFAALAALEITKRPRRSLNNLPEEGTGT